MSYTIEINIKTFLRNLFIFIYNFKYVFYIEGL